MTSQLLHPWLHGWSQEKNIEMWTQIHGPEEDQTSPCSLLLAFTLVLIICTILLDGWSHLLWLLQVTTWLEWSQTRLFLIISGFPFLGNGNTCPKVLTHLTYLTPDNSEWAKTSFKSTCFSLFLKKTGEMIIYKVWWDEDLYSSLYLPCRGVFTCIGVDHEDQPLYCQYLKLCLTLIFR